MSIYANGLLIHMNEIALLEFRESNQVFNGPVSLVSVQYDTLKLIHSAIGEAISQQEMRLHEISRAKSAIN